MSAVRAADGHWPTGGVRVRFRCGRGRGQLAQIARQHQGAGHVRVGQHDQKLPGPPVGQDLVGAQALREPPRASRSGRSAGIWRRAQRAPSKAPTASASTAVAIQAITGATCPVS